MKTRNGFVSNSSSSSFIVLFPNKPKTRDELKSMMFPKYDGNERIKSDYCDQYLTVWQVVDRVFSDMNNGQKDRINTVKDALNGHIEEIDSDTMVDILREIWHETSGKESEIYRQLVKEYGDEKWDSNKKDPKYKELVKARIESEKACKKYFRKRISTTKKLYNDFRERYEYHLYQRVFEYGDRYGENILENGWIFRNVPHIKISNH